MGNMKIQDETVDNSMTLEQAMKLIADQQAKLAELTAPVTRQKAFKVRTGPDGADYIQAYGNGVKLTRSSALWLLDHVTDLKTCLDENPQVK